MFPALLAQGGAPGGWNLATAIIASIAGAASLIALVLLARYFNLWIQARTTNANVSLLDLIGMTFRKVNPAMIVRCKVMAIQSGLVERDGLTTRGLEAHALAGGNVPDVVRALVAAHRADIPLSFKRATAIDLAGRDVLE